MTADHLNRIVELLERTRFLVDEEKRLQTSIASTLTDAGIAFAREVRLAPGDIIDFLSERVGIEVKIKGGKRSIMRQLERYAASDQLDFLILVTAVALGLPEAIRGKPVRIVSIGRAWL